MIDPILRKIQNSPQPASIEDDPRFIGFPWRGYKAPAPVLPDRRGRLDTNGLHASAGGRYVRIPADMIVGTNLAVVHGGQAMFLPHDQIPAYTRPATIKNPQTYHFYLWQPTKYEHDGKWLSLADFHRAVMPNHREPDHVPAVPKTKEYFEQRRKLAQSKAAEAVRYICTCGRRHQQTVYPSLGDMLKEHCEDGGLMSRVIGTKYICTCGKNHARRVFHELDERPPEKCPDDGEMRAEVKDP